MHHRKYLPVFACLVLCVRLAVADNAAPEDGFKLYRQHCGQCHGRQLKFLHDISRQQFAYALANGKGAMPPMGRGLSERERELIWAYIQR